VWLDTSIDEGVRAYEEIGFEVLGECAVDTGADAEGIKLGSGADEEVREKVRKRSRQWVMLRLPPEEGKADGPNKGQRTNYGSWKKTHKPRSKPIS